MKRCPQCKRVESDEALRFCRVDGATLVNDSGSVSSDVSTAKFGSIAVSNEIETSVLPHRTAAEISRPTEPKTDLPALTSSTTSELLNPRHRGVLFGVIVVAIVLGIAIGGYFYFSRMPTSAIQSLAVMPFVNASGNADLDYLSDGMTETLIRSLSQLPNLNVKASSSVFCEYEKAIEAVVKQGDRGFFWFFLNRSDPFLDPIRNDPRFKEAMKKLDPPQ